MRGTKNKNLFLNISDKDGTLQVRFYRLIEIHADESADGLVKVVMDKLKEDGLVDQLKQRLVGVVTDSGTYDAQSRKFISLL